MNKIKLLKVFAGVLSVSMAAPAFAQPVYLKCTNASDPANVWEIALNEDSRSAQITVLKSGYSTSSTAVFTQDRVDFRFDETAVTINRTNLAISASQMIGSRAMPLYDGVCEVSQPVKRAF